MSRFIEFDWQTLSPLLDRALDLEDGERRHWLRELARERPGLAGTVESLLDRHRLVVAQDFLGATAAPLPFSSGVGQRVGAYTLTAPLGEGGMGTVWLARRSDGRFEGQAAVKFLMPGTVRGTGAARFRREGNLLAQLTHPNIARLLDAGITPQGQPYLVLEYVEGERIDTYCSARQLGLEDRIRLFLDVLGAVAEAHRKLIVHRDIKPSNVFVRGDGIVKLIDFGVAKLMDEGSGGSDPLTREGPSAFTPEYAAPEHIRGEPVTTATDVYALGVLLFELLTGNRPFSRADKLALGASDDEPEPPRPSRSLEKGDHRLERELEGDLDNIVTKALRPSSGDRYGSVQAFADDLRRHLAHEPVAAHADGYAYRTRKFIRRHRGGVAAGTAVALTLIVATIATTLQTIEAQRQRDEAHLQLRRAQASNDFVTSLLSQAGPDGRGLTPVELIDRGIQAITERYDEDPQFAIHMLLVLSGRYMDLGRTDKEYQALLDAEALARRSGDPVSLLNVLCNMVETEVFGGRRSAALAHMQEARRLLLASDPVEPMIEANCLRQEAVLLEREDILRGIANLERAKTLLEENDHIYGNVYSSLFSWLSAFNQQAGRYLAAHRYHEQEVALAVRHRREQTVAGATARAGLANSFYRLGEVRRAVDAFEAEAAGGSALLDLHPVIPAQYGLALSALGRHEEALVHIEQGVSAAAAHGQQYAVLHGFYARSVAMLGAGRLADAQAALDLYAANVEVDGGPVARSRIFTQQAAIHLAHSRLVPALAAIDTALALLGHPDAPLGSVAAAALTLRSEIRLAAGDGAAAARDAALAFSILERDVPDPDRSATAGTARLALAQAQAAAGNVAGAQRHAVHAHRSLSNGLGARHPRALAAAALSRPLGG